MNTALRTSETSNNLSQDNLIHGLNVSTLDNGAILNCSQIFVRSALEMEQLLDTMSDLYRQYGRLYLEGVHQKLLTMASIMGCAHLFTMNNMDDSYAQSNISA
jgi:hypothetical protein